MASLCSTIPVGESLARNQQTPCGVCPDFTLSHFILYFVGKQAFHSYKIKSGSNFRCFLISCGEGGIRTPGTSQYAGFQDRCNRPLCHLSKGFLCLTMWSFRFDVAKVYQRFEPCKSLQEKFQIFFQFRAFGAVFLFVYYVFH